MRCMKPSIALETPVALKTIRPEWTDDEQVLTQFRSKFRWLAKLRIRNVCRIHDLFFESRLAFLSMELIPARLWPSVFAGKALYSPEIALPPGPSGGRPGAAAAHEYGIVHRDLEDRKYHALPRSQGRFSRKVMDFPGIASMQGRTDAGALRGTPRYMAPEQRNRFRDVLADIFALESSAMRS